MTAGRLYIRLMGISVRSQMQYKMSFLLQALGHFLITGGEFLGIWALFARFGSMNGWLLEEIAVFYGTVNVTWSIADSLTTGFDRLGNLVRQGDFDRYLLRPRGTVLQLMGYEFTLRRVGRLLQGLIVLVYGLISSSAFQAPVDLLTGIPLLLWTIVGGVAFFTGLLIMQAVMAFKTVEALEIMNVFTYGGVEAAQYPFSIYARWFRRLFTVVVPLGAVSYYPVVTLLKATDPTGTPSWAGWVSPVAGFLFLGLALAIWRRGVRWYTSTGS